MSYTKNIREIEIAMKYTDEQLRKALDEYFENLPAGCFPTGNGCDAFLNARQGPEKLAVMRRLFGGKFQNALVEYVYFYSDRKGFIQKFAEEYKRILPKNKVDFSKRAKRGANYYCYRTGLTYRELVEKASPKIEEIKEEYLLLWKNLDRQPTPQDMVSAKLRVKYKRYENLFQTEKQFIEYIGLTPRTNKEHRVQYIQI